MTMSADDVYHSLVKHAQSVLTDAPVRVEDVREPTKAPTAWYVLHLLSLVPMSSRNADLNARGTFRVRGRWKTGPLGGTTPIDQGWRMGRAMAAGFRGANVAVRDYASGSGSNVVGVVEFDEVEMTALEPESDIATMLMQAAFIASADQ